MLMLNHLNVIGKKGYIIRKNSFEVKTVEEATRLIEELKKMGYIFESMYTIDTLFNKYNCRFLLMFCHNYGNFVSMVCRPMPYLLDGYTFKEEKEFLDYFRNMYQINNPTKQYIKNVNKVKLSLQNISDGLGVGVPPDLMEIVY